MYLTRKHLKWIIAILVILLVGSILTGCVGFNPGCGGARGC